ncbi:MAG TPA: xanthine dehydrogenase family protein molybdopterin-binding subunit [Thermoplasmata archaeon]|nr:xanthine dehydrogenase family protein molybdopterin-binding subunit [Thermoplasmata archaeon]
MTTPTSRSRPDGEVKLHGAALYGTDLDVPGMLWGALVPSPVAHGTIRSIDLSAARALPGVTAVGAEDLDRLLPFGARDEERPLFPRGEVIYHHQPLAAVAAPTLAEAVRAAREVRVAVDPLPIVSDLESVFPEWPGSGAANSPHVAAHVHARHGDVEGEFSRADRVVQEVYRTASVHQVALEPHACLAEVQDGRWYVRTSTQTPFGVREDLAVLLGVPESSIVVRGTWVGGGFGGKGAPLLEPYALLLARASGRPVRLALGYREEFQLGRTTLPAVVRMETAVTGGRIRARRVRLLLDVGTSLPGRDFATGYSIGFLLGPYATATFEIEGYAVRTNKPPFGPHRAPLAPQCAFVVESHLDHVARESGEDPEEFRARHIWTEGDTTPLGQTVGPFGLGAALERARETAKRWRREAPPGHGVGVGVGFWSTSTGAGGEVRLRLTASEVVIEQGEREIGSGSVLVGLPAVAARSLGVPRERVRVDYSDTSTAPFDSGVFGSRTVGAMGRAIEEASLQLLAVLGKRLAGGAPATLREADGRLLAASGGHEAPVADLLTPEERTTGGMVAGGRHFGPPGTLDEHRVVDGTFYAYRDFTGAAHVAEVSVDRETGSVRVERYAAFHDIGVVIDPAAARAQVEGGVAMGLGTALTEEAIWSDAGELENAGLKDYRIPTLGEVPPVEVDFLEGFPGAGPFGAKGLGEPPMIPVPAAVALAVREACGAHATELPLSAERVARALKLL